MWGVYYYCSFPITNECRFAGDDLFIELLSWAQLSQHTAVRSLQPCSMGMCRARSLITGFFYLFISSRYSIVRAIDAQHLSLTLPTIPHTFFAVRFCSLWLCLFPRTFAVRFCTGSSEQLLAVLCLRIRNRKKLWVGATFLLTCHIVLPSPSLVVQLQSCTYIHTVWTYKDAHHLSDAPDTISFSATTLSRSTV